MLDELELELEELLLLMLELDELMLDELEELELDELELIELELDELLIDELEELELELLLIELEELLILELELIGLLLRYDYVHLPPAPYRKNYGISRGITDNVEGAVGAVPSKGTVFEYSLSLPDES